MMNLTRKEIATIEAAIKVRNRNRFLRPFVFLFFVAVQLAYLFGYLSPEVFGVAMFISVLMATTGYPRSFGAPGYNDLVEILENHMSDMHYQPSPKEVVMRELKKHNKTPGVES